jgi:sortase A
VCDTESKNLVNQYKLQFSRIVKERDLSEKELEFIYNNIKDSCEELKSRGVCKKSDLKNISESVITKVEDHLIDAITTVVEAPTIYGEESTIRGIIIDRENKTVHIISDNSIADKFEINSKTFNYVGPNKVVLITTYSFIGIFIVGLVLLIVLRKNKLFNIPLIAIEIVSLLFTIILIVNSKPINNVIGYIKMMQRPKDLVSKKIVVQDRAIKQYPSYYDEYAILKIKSIGLEEKVAFGDSPDILAGNIGHTTTSYLPGEGKTIIYSGHNYKLNNLDRLNQNDEILITTSYGEFTYKVVDTRIMNVFDYNDIKVDTDNERLILYTCYPFSNLVYGNKRYVVFAELTKESWL